jgi:hypothetical protein
MANSNFLGFQGWFYNRRSRVYNDASEENSLPACYIALSQVCSIFNINPRLITGLKLTALPVHTRNLRHLEVSQHGAPEQSRSLAPGGIGYGQVSQQSQYSAPQDPYAQQQPQG